MKEIGPIMCFTMISSRQLSYPDEAHGLVGLRPHFYHALTDFLLNDCFGRNEVAACLNQSKF